MEAEMRFCGLVTGQETLSRKQCRPSHICGSRLTRLSRQVSRPRVNRSTNGKNREEGQQRKGGAGDEVLNLQASRHDEWLSGYFLSAATSGS